MHGFNIALDILTNTIRKWISSIERKKGRKQHNSSSTITKAANDVQTTMTVTNKQETNKRKVESRGESPLPSIGRLQGKGSE